MDQTMFFFWMIAAIVLAIVEAATTALVTIWFAGGAVLAMICAWLGVGFLGQMGMFVAGSLVLLLLTRPLAKRMTRRESQPTNADRIIGQTGTVTEKIVPTENTGRISVMGQSWAGASASGEEIEAGTLVIVTEIQGVKAMVIRKGE